MSIMSGENKLLLCYNRGCGKNFNPDDNKKDDCVFHPGQPVFHDAYKGWSCCSKKCTDFTEFLNIKGCTKSYHTNEKPPEPEKPIVDKSKASEVIEVNIKPINNDSALERPPFDTPQVIMTPSISPVLLEQIKGLTASTNDATCQEKITIGQSCKNNACKEVYNGPPSDDEICNYHPGVPIFHEGIKYWSCCKKKTTDFNTFLGQPGCTEGHHVWISKKTNKQVECRMDWHQTASHVIISVFAKKYQPDKSFVKLNPIHLTVNLYFLEEDSTYNLDIELRGVVDVNLSKVSMLPSKVEIKLKKAEPGSWTKINFPREFNDKPTKENSTNEDNISAQVDAVDLNDL